ncbi:uncharacterized protein LOC115519932 [Lynx canadensis]|uniref:uncharacterized protein LOC115519932 n=1 Tax=Lynx canadensis TaxID=61383 RepID=UPI0011B0C82A|nr:uncharacterized protein LOC115519932 [Lynx canadensis]
MLVSEPPAPQNVTLFGGGRGSEVTCRPDRALGREEGHLEVFQKGRQRGFPPDQRDVRPRGLQTLGLSTQVTSDTGARNLAEDTRKGVHNPASIHWQCLEPGKHRGARPVPGTPQEGGTPPGSHRHVPEEGRKAGLALRWLLLPAGPVTDFSKPAQLWCPQVVLPRRPLPSVRWRTAVPTPTAREAVSTCDTFTRQPTQASGISGIPDHQSGAAGRASGEHRPVILRLGFQEPTHRICLENTVRLPLKIPRRWGPLL